MCNTESFYQHNQAPETKKSFLRVIGAQTFGSRGLRRWGKGGRGEGEAITWSSAIGVCFFFRRPSSMINRSTTMTSVKVPEFLMLMAVKTIPILLCADRSGNIFLISSPSGFCLSFLFWFQISRWDIRLSILVFQAFFFCNQRALPLRKIDTTENGTLFYPQ